MTWQTTEQSTEQFFGFLNQFSGFLSFRKGKRRISTSTTSGLARDINNGTFDINSMSTAAAVWLIQRLSATHRTKEVRALSDG